MKLGSALDGNGKNNTPSQSFLQKASSNFRDSCWQKIGVLFYHYFSWPVRSEKSMWELVTIHWVFVFLLLKA